MEELRGMPVVKAIAEDLTEKIEALKKNGVTPTLAVVRVGQREDDLSYERGLLKRFDQVGANVKVRALAEDISEDELIDVIKECNGDDNIHGILLFRPLPKSINEKRVVEFVSPDKDVDCMTISNLAHTFMQDGEGFEPCTARAVMEMLDHYKVDLTGKRVTVVGRSLVVGKPLSMMLQKGNATVTMCHTKTRELKEECQRADIICACAGVAGMINEEFVSEGQIIMDVGINVVDGKLCGDVDYSKAEDIISAATPVPGGVGTVTTSILLKNTVMSAIKHTNR